ncbi:MAG: ComF family protein [Desulfobacteraceae bacterium]|nr:ComF family protein [Desulfobacteraceae bacterium]
MAAYLCDRCAEEFREVHSPLCLRCGEPFASPHGPDHICGQCLEHPFQFQKARAAGLYEGPLRATIHQFKYQRRDNLAKPLGRLLWATFSRHWDPLQMDLIVPVPLHSRRLRQRGFNQAQVMTLSWPTWARQIDVAVGPGWVDSTVMERCKVTQPQTGLRKEERALNLRKAFRVVKPGRIQDKRILLVDDVLTTGATANACARELLNAGAAEVHVLTLARAV